jgi:ribosomal protein S18 acetylase RimI-like enzyme
MSEIKTANAPARLQRRVATAADEHWLRQFFALLRGLEPAMLAACPALLEQQWQLRQRVFASRHPGARTELLLLHGRTIGMLTLDRCGSLVRILEFALEPRHRGQGLGERLLDAIARQADSQGHVLELAVMRDNPALRLYLRLGFQVLAGGEDEVQLQMRRDPVQSA